MTLATRFFHWLLIWLLAGPLAMPGLAHASSKTHVGGSPEFLFTTVTADLAQSLDPRPQNPSCNYDFAPGVHKYLYCQDNPVNGTDSSGHEFNLTTMQAMTALSVGINGWSAGVNIRKGRYAMAAVDILSMGFGIGGMGGPTALRQLATAAVGGRGLTIAQWVAASRGAMQVSQGVAIFDIVMMAMSGASTGGTLGSPGSDENVSALLPNLKSSEYSAELATARANKVTPTKINNVEQLTQMCSSSVVKWVVTANNQLRMVPKMVNGREISHAVAAENQSVKAAGEARLKGGYLEFNRWSGHYQPPSYSPGQRALEGLGIPVKYVPSEF